MIRQLLPCLKNMALLEGKDPLFRFMTCQELSGVIQMNLFQLSKKLSKLRDLSINGIPLKKKHLKILASLPHLITLRLRGCDLDDEELEAIKDMVDLELLTITHTSITDEGLKYLAQMKKLRRLDLPKTQIRGPGLAYLKGFDQLEWLNLGSTLLDDSGMPHVAANFPKLTRFSFGNTKVTPEGLMQLVDLHWLGHIGPPEYIGVPDHLKNEKGFSRWEYQRPFFRKFGKAHLASKRKARVTGMTVPPDWAAPLGFNVPKEMELKALPLERANAKQEHSQ